MVKRIVAAIMRRAFGKYLLQTNVLTSGFLMGLGDFVEQKIEVARKIHPEGELRSDRIGHMTVVGLVIGVPQHYFYRIMDRRMPGTTLRVTAKKIFLDQAVASPFSIFLFFVGLGVLQHHSFSKGFQEFKHKFGTVYMVDCAFWPPAQFLNFMFVSPKYRVLYVNALTAVYDIALSYMKFILKITDNQ